MAERIRVGNMESERQHVEVGQDGGENPGKQQAARYDLRAQAKQAKTDGQRYGSVGKDGWHSRL